MNILTPILGVGPQKDRPFPRYAADYFQQVRQQYEILVEESGAALPSVVRSLLARIDGVLAEATSDKDRRRRLRETVTWADVFALETATIYALDDAKLAAALWTVRVRYREVAGQDAYDEYMRGPVSDTTKSAVIIRADLLSLCDRMRYLYTFVPTKEAQRNRVSRLMTAVMVAAIVLPVVLYPLFRHAGWALPSEPLMMVLLAGGVGGFISIQQRLQQSTGVDPLFKELELAVSGLDTLASPALGAVFASVLYLVFVAHLVTGGLFPEFVCGAVPLPTAEPTADLAGFTHCAYPLHAADWAKLAVWAFIAGFAERFVPDVLTRLAAAGSSSTQRDATPASR
jgi:hypothetical protein